MNLPAAPDANPLSEWQNLFNRDILTMHQLMLLRTRKDDEASRRQMYPWIKQIADAIVDLEKSARNLTRYVAEERSQLSQLHSLQSAIATQKDRLELIKLQVPTEVSDQLKLSEEEQHEEGYCAVDKENFTHQPVVEVVAKPDRDKLPLPRLSGRKSSVAAEGKAKTVRKQSSGAKVAASGKGKSGGRKESTVTVGVPVIRSVTKSELSAAPQYVKGRLTLEKIERVTQSLNKIAADKYRLLGKGFRELSPSERDLYQELKENECEETKGMVYLTEAEIKGFGKLRIDSTVKSVINVLRHVGSLKHVRGKNKSTILLITN